MTMSIETERRIIALERRVTALEKWNKLLRHLEEVTE